MACNCIGGNPCPCQRGAWPMGRIEFGPNAWGAAPMTVDLTEALEKARLHVMTPKEIYEQKISWIRGMSGKLNEPMPSRESVVKALEAMGVVDPEPSPSATGGRS